MLICLYRHLPPKDLLCITYWVMPHVFIVWRGALSVSWLPGPPVHRLPWLPQLCRRTSSIWKPHFVRSACECWARVPYRHLRQPPEDSAGTAATRLLRGRGGRLEHGGEGAEAERSTIGEKAADITMTAYNNMIIYMIFVRSSRSLKISSTGFLRNTTWQK